MKSFAFKVANATETKEVKVREGVAVAGCTDPSGWGLYRYRTSSGDNGVYC